MSRTLSSRRARAAALVLAIAGLPSIGAAAPALPTAQAPAVKLMVVDAAVPDAELLLQGSEGFEVVRIEPGDAPFRAIADAATRLGAIESLVVVAHGADGGISLGGQWLDSGALATRGDALASIGASLTPDADILLFACDVAASEHGEQFVQTFAALTGHSVAASDDATGSEAAGADWNLEYTVGDVATVSPFAAQARAQYTHTLSHFRGGAVTWQVADLDNDGLKNDVLITVKTAWRYNSVNSVSSLASSPALTVTQLSEDRIYVNGDSSGADYALQTTLLEARDLDPDTHYLVRYTGCCRISDLLNNANGSWDIQAEVFLSDGNLAPKIDLPIIMEVPQLQSDGVTTLANWTADIGSTDPNADKLRYRLANLVELGGGSSTNPDGLSINPNTGLLTWSDSGTMAAGVYSGGLVAEDVDNFGNVKSKSHIDFILDLQPRAAVAFTTSGVPETRNIRVEKGDTYAFSIGGTNIAAQSLGDVQGALTEPSDNSFVFDPGPVGSGLLPGAYPITLEIVDQSGTYSKSYLTLNFIVPDPNAPRIANVEGDRTVYSGAGAETVDVGLDANVTDADDTELDGGLLKLNVTFTDGEYEVLAIESVGDGPGEIRVTGQDVFFEGNAIGVVDPTEDGVGRALRVDFTTPDATLSAVQALVHSLTYQDTFTLRGTGDRGLSLFLRDDAGNANAYDLFVDIQSHPSAPPPGGGPVQASNRLTIVEGATISLSDENINYADPDADPITLTVSNVQRGQFEYVSDPGVAIASFTQSQVTLGQIAFAHDGGEVAPSYDISASDGTNPATAPAAATVEFAGVNDAPVISGSPATTAQAGVAYAFTPSVADPENALDEFGIAGLPAWASFDTVTGTLGGTPTSDDVGTYTGIVITVTDNGGLSDTLAGFTIAVSDPCAADPYGAVCLSIDTDGDGLSNGDEDALGSDRNDPDTDGDGVSDGVEVGDPNAPADSDGDGIIDLHESDTADADGDGFADAVDSDSDNDGIGDDAEVGADATSPVDSDGDGVPDLHDRDSDGDGVPDVLEVRMTAGVPADSDGDGTPDYRDLDSDDDGIPDRLEHTPAGVDADGDGIDDAYDASVTGGQDANLDGVDDAILLADPDGDGLPSMVDPDSDNDGIADSAEGDVAGADGDADGIDDAFDPDHTGGFDADGDGIDDAYALPDTDGDGIADVVDLDADDDGWSDTLEAGLLDLDDDGLADAGQTLVTSPPDTDGDGVADYRDLDYDGDGTFDVESSRWSALDTDADGRIDPGPDTDGDGLRDVADDDPLGFGNWRDSDGDGVPDSNDADIDNDGIPNALDGVGIDSDGDGITNDRDLDSDNDGIPDLVEAGGSDPNGTGRVAGFEDADGDGLGDAFDPDAGGTALPVHDADGDGAADHIDTDSDGDGISDLFETGNADADGDGRVDAFVDVDGNGLHDGFDVSRGGTPSLVKDTDGDGLADYRDPDSDGDGFPDAAEGVGDGDGNGVPDYLEQAPGFETGVSGTGATDLWLLLVLGALFALRRHARVAAGMVVLAGVMVLGPVEKTYAQSDTTEPRWLLGVDLGATTLDPRGGGDSLFVSDDSDLGLRLSAGYRWSDRWSFEAFYLDAGEARIASRNPAIGDIGGLEYRMLGVGAAFHFLAAHDARTVQPYLLAGISRTSNDATDARIIYARGHRTSVYAGIGGAWRVSGPWTLNTEIVSYNRDQRSMSIGIRRGF